MEGVVVATFAQRLKGLRAKAGLSQSGLANGSGLSISIINDYEQGKREPTLRSAVQFADALGVDCRSLADDGPEVKKPARPAARKSKPPKK